MDSTHSIHALVRLLKSPTDPPSTPGPSKIEIACLSWSDSSFRAANKGEVIGEWVLTLLGQAKKTRRERDAISTFDPTTDPRYWNLLSEVLTTPPPTTARPIKTWLLPLLNRLRLDTIVIELLASHAAQVLSPARAALTVLWPLAHKKVGVDALGECLSAVFDACAEWERVDDNLGWICSVVISAYRDSLANAGKKLYNSFLTTHLSSWLCAIRASPSAVAPSPTKQLSDSIYAVGADTLFSLDALKQPPDTLFDALCSSMFLISSLLPVLPKIFASFLSAMHRHRSALFVSATSVVGGKEEARNKGMEFVGRCWSQIWCCASLPEDLEVEKWKSVIGVFEIVQKERLFAVHSIRGMHKGMIYGGCKGEVALSEARDKVVEMLESADTSFKNYQAELLVLSTQLLDVLVQVEYDFIGSILERVLSALINIPPSLFHLIRTPSLELLTHVLEYHTKTRTVHTYVLALLNAVLASSASISSPPMTSTFPLLHHLPALAHALRTSLIPTQTSPLAIAVLRTVENAWTAFEGANQVEERVVKKRKVAEDTDKSGRTARSVLTQARVFSYAGRVAGVVLSNLPADAYTKDEEYYLEHLWDDVGKLSWTVIWGCLREDTEEGGEHGTVQGRDSKKRKLAVETSPLSAFCPHIVTSAALRFLYDVRSRLSFPLGDCDRLGEAQIRTLLDVARSEASDPELVLEAIRTILWHSSYTHELQNQTKIQPIFTVILDILTTHLSSESKWSGVSGALTRENLGLAILYVLTDRWIDVFDALASTEDMEKFISLLFGISLDLPGENTRKNSDEICLQRNPAVITLSGILLNLLRNAQFWELHNIRAVFLSSALAQTAPAAVETPTTVAAENELTPACNVYTLLHFVPSEYFTRPVRAELVKRAMDTDIQICIKLDGRRGKGERRDVDKSNPVLWEKIHTTPADESKSWLRRLTFVRTFLQRMGQFINTPNHTISSAFVNHLLSPPPCIYSPSKVLIGVTLDLIQSHAMSLLRSREAEAATSFSAVVFTLITARPFSRPDSRETWAHIVVQSTILKLVQHLTGNFDAASLPDLVKHALKTLLETLEVTLLPRAQKLIERDTMELDQFFSSEQINAWVRILLLRRWLGMNLQVAVTPIPLGRMLAISTICRDTSARLEPETYSSILELLFEELWCMPDISHRAHLDVLVSFYAVDNGNWNSNGHIMDTCIAQASKKLTIEDFSRLLDVLAEGIGGGGLQAGQRECLIHLGMIMLHDAPQGTLRVIQNFATRCFNLFTDQENIYGGSSHLRMQYLEFIAKHCSDRPAAIRSVDLGSIWSLLNKTLSGSSHHDATTAFPIFHHIVTIIGALIRLRRDLVVHTLPHLSLVLRQLLMLTRKIRPQLGAKQGKIVTDTFPSWLSASQPLSTDEARALARLLTSLTAKTVPRTHRHAHLPTSIETQKVESLAKPFAKHASYVLVAYVDAFNDPLCIINAEMRRDLEPGLFALCEMVGEHSRDALMVSALDSGGKMIMKSLWREYEKQRYVGKG